MSINDIYNLKVENYNQDGSLEKTYKLLNFGKIFKGDHITIEMKDGLISKVFVNKNIDKTSKKPSSKIDDLYKEEILTEKKGFTLNTADNKKYEINKNGKKLEFSVLDDGLIEISSGGENEELVAILAPEKIKNVHGNLNAEKVKNGNFIKLEYIEGSFQFDNALLELKLLKLKTAPIINIGEFKNNNLDIYTETAQSLIIEAKNKTINLPNLKSVLHVNIDSSNKLNAPKLDLDSLKNNTDIADTMDFSTNTNIKTIRKKFGENLESQADWKDATPFSNDTDANLKFKKKSSSDLGEISNFFQGLNFKETFGNTIKNKDKFIEDINKPKNHIFYRLLSAKTAIKFSGDPTKTDVDYLKTFYSILKSGKNIKIKKTNDMKNGSGNRLIYVRFKYKTIDYGLYYNIDSKNYELHNLSSRSKIINKKDKQYVTQFFKTKFV